jgi:hypothetical protein
MSSTTGTPIIPLGEVISTSVVNGATVTLHEFAPEDLSDIFNTVAHKVGDIVHIKERDWKEVAGTYVVEKINRATYDLIPEAGQGLTRPARFDKSGVFAGRSPETIAPREVTHGLGVAVTVKGRETVWVVVKVLNGKHTLYPLGGATDGRYLRGVPSSMLTVLTEVLWEANV